MIARPAAGPRGPTERQVRCSSYRGRLPIPPGTASAAGASICGPTPDALRLRDIRSARPA